LFVFHVQLAPLRCGIGADIVIRDMQDLPTIINFFLDLKLDCPDKCKRPFYDFSTVGGLCTS
jgi:hypothetical protein